MQTGTGPQIQSRPTLPSFDSKIIMAKESGSPTVPIEEPPKSWAVAIAETLRVLYENLALLLTGYQHQFNPPPPTFSEEHVGTLTGKVFVVTGGSSGIGKELASALYSLGGKVYVLARNQEKTEGVFGEIRSAHPTPQAGAELKFVAIELSDLRSVRAAADAFTAAEQRLDVLFLNAGVAHHAGQTRTAQGLEWHVGVNTVAAFALQEALEPVLARTAAAAKAAGAVRVVWAASVLVDWFAPVNGVRLDMLARPERYPKVATNYALSKTANWFLAAASARRRGGRNGVVYVAGNPGSYRTDVWRSAPGYVKDTFWWLLREQQRSHVTYLWMGFSDEVTMQDAVAGRYAICDGRWHPNPRPSVVQGMKPVEEGGTGYADVFYDQCVGAVKEHVRISPLREKTETLRGLRQRKQAEQAACD